MLFWSYTCKLKPWNCSGGRVESNDVYILCVGCRSWANRLEQNSPAAASFSEQVRPTQALYERFDAWNGLRVARRGDLHLLGTSGCRKRHLRRSQGRRLQKLQFGPWTFGGGKVMILNFSKFQFSPSPGFRNLQFKP